MIISMLNRCPITNRYYILKLDLSWNKLRQDTSLSLWSVIATHRSLTTLDISWNPLGSGLVRQCKAYTDEIKGILADSSARGKKVLDKLKMSPSSSAAHLQNPTT
jgi:hypothetical protein